MDHRDFWGMSELTADGEMIWVENQLKQKGRVVGCAANMIEVDVGGHYEKWSADDCTEMTHGFKVKYGEVLKHPHEYDTHLD